MKFSNYETANEIILISKEIFENQRGKEKHFRRNTKMDNYICSVYEDYIVVVGSEHTCYINLGINFGIKVSKLNNVLFSIKNRDNSLTIAGRKTETTIKWDELSEEHIFSLNTTGLLDTPDICIDKCIDICKKILDMYS